MAIWDEVIGPMHALILDPSLCRITELMGSVVSGAGVNPADQHWGYWPLLPLSFQLQKAV